MQIRGAKVMKLFLLSSVISLSVAALGAAVDPTAATEGVVLPLEKVRPHFPGVPDGADFRVRRGTSSRLAFAACDQQRAYSNGALEYGCRLYSEEQNRWGSALHWYSSDAVRPLIEDTGRMVTALR